MIGDDDRSASEEEDSQSFAVILECLSQLMNENRARCRWEGVATCWAPSLTPRPLNNRCEPQSSLETN